MVNGMSPVVREFRAVVAALKPFTAVLVARPAANAGAPGGTSGFRWGGNQEVKA